MPLCELCKDRATEHIRKISTRELFIRDLPMEYIKDLTDTELFALDKYIHEGVMICNDCLKLCKLGDRDCTKEKLELAKYYITSGKHTLDNISKEKGRRTYRKDFYESFSSYLKK